MEEKAGVQIGQRAFIQSVVILFLLMMAAGVLTRVVPAGSYTRELVNGREVINPTSYQAAAQPVNYPIWRWFTAPFEVLAGPDGLTVIVILLFLLMVGVSFAVLDKTGILKNLLGRLVRRFGARKYVLLLVISFFFMVIGAFFGIFEEVVPLVPIMIALAYSLGWDTLVGLGMSILATNMGFSAAITNPFTIGVAQKLAGLPLFSGSALRVLIFLAIYAVLAVFLVLYARKIDRNPEASEVYREDLVNRKKYAGVSFENAGSGLKIRPALVWLAVFLVLIVAVLFSAPFVPAISDYSLPIVGILFLAAGLGAGFLSGAGRKTVWQSAREGLLGIAPAIPLILMAASIKFIVTQGGIMDTMLHNAVSSISQASPFMAAVIIYALALIIELFVASGSAKAFLMMPILLPIADLVGVTRQVAVTAYCFGDGFSNLAYPTNPVLLICLGLAVVSYPRWLKWTARLWLYVLVVTLAFLGIAVAIHFGPF